MKTRILAFVLACLMLVSMLPVSLLAADAPKCPGEGAGHIKDDNCTSYTTIKIVPKDQCKDGYTLYQCDVCMTDFISDIVPGDHAWDNTPGKIDATCHSDGKSYDAKCTKCGALKNETPITNRPDHEFDYSKVHGTDKTGKPIYKCENCDATTVYTCPKWDSEHMKHDWTGVRPTIKVAPTTTTEGVALYKCDEPKCNFSEEVVIHNHFDPNEDAAGVTNPNSTLTHVPGKAATCENDEVIEHWVCSICGPDKIYLSTADAMFYISYPASAAVGESKKAHTFDGSKPDLNIVIGDCDVDGSRDRYCSMCEEYIHIEEGRNHANVHHVKVVATCMTVGREYDLCALCGQETNVQTYGLDTTGHTAYKADELTKWGTLVQYKEWTYTGTEATCTADGSLTVKCEGCSTKAGFDVYRKYDFGKLGHDLVDVVVAPTCLTNGFTYQVCKREGCTANADITEFDLGNNVKGYVYKVDKDTNMMVKETVKWFAESGVKDVTAPAAGSHFGVVTPVKDATCEDDGYGVHYCALCDELFDSTYPIPAITHNWPVIGNDDHKAYISEVYTTYAGCQGPETTVYTLTCMNTSCGKTKKVTEYGETFDKAEEYLYSMAEAERDHNLAGNMTVYRPGTCEIQGLFKDTCNDCGRIILVLNETTGHHTYLDGTETIVGTPALVPATCQTNAYYPEWTCTNICGLTFAKQEIEDSKVDHVYEETDAAVEPECDVDGKEATYNCKWCKKLTDDETKDGSVINKFHHTDSKTITKVAAVAPKCGVAGNVAYWYCSECDKNWTPETFASEIKDTVDPALDHDVVLATEFGLVCSHKPEENFGMKYYRCTRDCGYDYVMSYESSKHEDGGLWPENAGNKAPTCSEVGTEWHKCKNCAAGYGVETAKVPHTNKDGVDLTDCKNTPDYRECKYCKVEIPFEHLYIIIEEVPATCLKDGYYTEYCKHCDEHLVDIVYYSADHKAQYPVNTWTDKGIVEYPTTEKEGVISKECPGCKLTQDVKFSGVEFVADATNAVEAAGKTYTDGSVVKLTVSLRGLPAMAARGVQFTVNYDASKVEFVGATYNSDSAFNLGEKPAAVVTGNDGKVTVMRYTTAADHVIDAEDTLVTLEFKITNKAGGDVTFDIADTKVVGKDNKNVSYIKNNDVTITVKTFMEAVDDAQVDISDFLAFYDMLGTKYDVAGDVNKNGTIDVNDLIAINDYIVGNKTYWDLVGYPDPNAATNP